jgi:hypothetical protein
METLARRYFAAKAAKAAKADRNIATLLDRNQPYRATDDDDALLPSQGYIYIFPVDGRESDLFRVGSTADYKKRLMQHSSSHEASSKTSSTLS